VGRPARDRGDLHLHHRPHPLAPQLAAVVPYVSGVIELDGTQGAGARLLLNITDADPDTVHIGDKVQIWFDQVSDTFPLPRARMA
jgi:uncharacterized protein